MAGGSAFRRGMIKLDLFFNDLENSHRKSGLQNPLEVSFPYFILPTKKRLNAVRFGRQCQ